MTTFCKIFGWILVGLVIFLMTVLFPIHTFFSFSSLNNNNLVIFTNEAEARPCGGFVTGVGSFQLFPFDISFVNSYALTKYDFGTADFPLNQVSGRKKFWDLGTDLGLSTCSKVFKSAYERTEKKKIDRVILVDFSTAEEIFALFGEINFAEKKLTSKNLFALLSRLVANIDRHDEEAIATRKKPLADLGKTLIWKALLNPGIAFQATRVISKKLQDGGIFVEGLSPNSTPGIQDFYVSEWNLGGAKTSRFLKKILKISIREVLPGKFNLTLNFSAKNLGGFDEPLSQVWKGEFEFKMPAFLGRETVFVNVNIAPGETFEREFVFQDIHFPMPVDLDLQKQFSIFLPRNQSLFIDFDLSLFPQKTFSNSTFPTHENVGTFFKKVTKSQKIFAWSENNDEISPFITLHEFVDMKAVPVTAKNNSANLYVEVHFNEVVKLDSNFVATLKDRDFANSKIHEDPTFLSAKLLQDGRTLILTFAQKTSQISERFYLNVEGVEDVWGNRVGGGVRTVLQR